MAEDTSQAAKSDDAGSAVDAGKTEKDLNYWQGEAHKAFAARDLAKEELKELKAKAAKLEAGEPKEKPPKDPGKKDPEVARLEALLTDATKKAEDLEKNLRSKTINEKFGGIVSDKVHKLTSVLAQLQYEGYALDVVGDDGHLAIKVPGGQIRYDVNKWVDEYLTENPHLAKNPRTAGTDTKGPGGQQSTNGKATAIPQDFGIWPMDKKKEWMRANPSLAAEAAAKALGG